MLQVAWKSPFHFHSHLICASFFKISSKYWSAGNNFHKSNAYKCLIQIASFSIFLTQQRAKPYYTKQFDIINIYPSPVVIWYGEVRLCFQHKFISTGAVGTHEIHIVTLMMFF